MIKLRELLIAQKRNRMEEHWVVADDMEAVEEIITRSGVKPQYIYKHSTQCLLSSRAYKEVARATEELHPDVEINYVDVIASRDVSNLIADKLNVRHESPQILLVWHGQAIWSASHRDVRKDEIIDRVKNLLNRFSS